MALNESPPAPLNSPEELESHIASVLGEMRSSLEQNQPINLKHFVKRLRTLRKPPYISMVSHLIRGLFRFRMARFYDQDALSTILAQAEDHLSDSQYDSFELPNSFKLSLVTVLAIYEDVLFELILTDRGLVIPSSSFQVLVLRMDSFERSNFLRPHIQWLNRFLSSCVLADAASSSEMSHSPDDFILFLNQVQSKQQELFEACARSYPSDRESSVDVPNFPSTLHEAHREIARLRRKLIRVTQERDGALRALTRLKKD